MRRGVALAMLIGLVVAVPAGARQQDETVTVRVGQRVPLRTVFVKKKAYTIVMSGLITRTLTDGSRLTYDPFFGTRAESCQGGKGIHFQIEDEHGRLLDSAAFGRPPCRRDHRYAFQVNDGPLLPDLVGRATAYIATLAPSPGVTDSGSFTLQIEPAARRTDVVFKVLAENELRASKKNELLADARLGGAGRIVDVGGLDRGRGVVSLTLVWLQRDDAHLVLRPYGTWSFNRKRMAVGGFAEVVKSDEPRCPKGSKLQVRLLERPRSDARIAPYLGCEGLDPIYLWTEAASEIAVRVREVSVG